MISPNSPPYTIYIVEFWRRSLEGREYTSNKIFSDYSKAKRYLLLNGYDFIDDNVYNKDNMRAILTERTVE